MLLVSINCITYNHENFISKALDGFLMQKTNFEYEIIIGEDCSTDNTRVIIEKYMNQYPNIIKLITSDSNVGMSSNNERVFKASMGKYIAICEGDDYWIDPNKLQKQVDFMKEHEECTMVFHSAKVLNVANNEEEDSINPYNKTMIINNTKLFYGGGDNIATASILYIRDFMNKKPAFYKASPVGDHALALLLSAHGAIGYINEVMSVRTLWVPGSWNTRYNRVIDMDKKVEHINAMERVLLMYNEYTNYRFENDIKRRVISGRIEMAKLKSIPPFKDSRVNEVLKQLKFRSQIRIKLGYYFPRIYSLYNKIKKM